MEEKVRSLTRMLSDTVRWHPPTHTQTNTNTHMHTWKHASLMWHILFSSFLRPHPPKRQQKQTSVLCLWMQFKAESSPELLHGEASCLTHYITQLKQQLMYSQSGSVPAHLWVCLTPLRISAYFWCNLLVVLWDRGPWPPHSQPDIFIAAPRSSLQQAETPWRMGVYLFE